MLLLTTCGSDNVPSPSPPPCPEVACLERVLEGHSQRVTSVAFAPDSRSLATAGIDATVKLWNLADGVLQRTLAEAASPVLSIAFARDGSLLAAGGEDATIRLWRPADGVRVRALRGAMYGITGLAFTADGHTLLASSNDHSVRFWDVASGRELKKIAAHPVPVTALALAPDDKSFATAGSFMDGRVRLWSFPAGSPTWGVSDDVAYWALAFSPDGRELAAGGSFGSVTLLSAADGSERGTLTMGDVFVPALAYTPDGRRLAAADASTIQIFDPGSGSVLSRLAGHAGTVFSIAASPDGRYLASGSDDGTARLWRFN